MKVLLPENISDVTLGQFQEYSALLNEETQDNIKDRTISIFTNLKKEYIKNVVKKDIDNMYNTIINALNQDVGFKDRFTMNGIEFGFIPNLDLITGAEWVDISKYQTDIENYHRLMAILFRPIKKNNRKGEYKIKGYNGTSEYAEQMKNTPMNIVNGALVFFYNLAKELDQITQRYIIQERAKAHRHLSTLKNGDGTQPSLI